MGREWTDWMGEMQWLRVRRGKNAETRGNPVQSSPSLGSSPVKDQGRGSCLPTGTEGCKVLDTDTVLQR